MQLFAAFVVCPHLSL